jgi:hypothetical protein
VNGALDYPFPLVDKQMSIRLDVSLDTVKPGRCQVVETALRLAREESYSFIRAFWCIWLVDGRRVAGVY